VRSQTFTFLTNPSRGLLSKVSNASPRFADIALRGRKFDLIVLSGLSDFDLQRIIGLADGAEVLVLDAFTMPRELLSLVAERLDLDRELKA